MAEVDIVIVNWNSGTQLGECLRSIQPTRPDAAFCLSKCIVVDNASADSSSENLERYPFDITIIRNSENRGFGAACNQGARLGAAEYVLFLNPDIRMEPDSLTRAVACMEENQRVGLLGIQLVDQERRIQPTTGRFPTPTALLYQMVGLDQIWPALFPPFVRTDWDHRDSRDVDVLQGAFLLARRSAFEQTGGFDERFFMYYEDVDLAYRMGRSGWLRYYFAGAHAFHRGAGTTETIKAGRLAYWMTSRVLYVSKHFGRTAAFGIVVASLTLELAARVIWNMIHLSRGHFLDTLRAYGKYVETLPRLLKS